MNKERIAEQEIVVEELKVQLKEEQEKLQEMRLAYKYKSQGSLFTFILVTAASAAGVYWYVSQMVEPVATTQW